MECIIIKLIYYEVNINIDHVVYFDIHTQIQESWKIVIKLLIPNPVRILWKTLKFGLSKFDYWISA